MLPLTRLESGDQNHQRMTLSRIKKTDIILEDLDTKPVKPTTPSVDHNQLRKSRGSTYAKFIYPEKFHKSSYNEHLLSKRIFRNACKNSRAILTNQKDTTVATNPNLVLFRGCHDTM